MKMEEAIKQLLEDVRKYMRQLYDQTTLNDDLVNGRMEILCKIDDFYRIHLDKGESGYIKKQSIDVQSITTQSTTVSSSSSDGTDVPMVAVTQLGQFAKAGVLVKKRKPEKLGGLLQGIVGGQKRWCVIKDGVLYYFENERSKKQNGAFHLNGYEAQSTSGSDKYAFSVTCPGKRSYFFNADSTESMEQWISVINTQSEVQPKGDDGPYNTGSIVSSASTITSGGDSLVPPTAPPRKASDAQASLSPARESAVSTASSFYEDTDTVPQMGKGLLRNKSKQGGVIPHPQHRPPRSVSAISDATLYEDTDEMERNMGQIRESDVGEEYEDTDVIENIAQNKPNLIQSATNNKNNSNGVPGMPTRGPTYKNQSFHNKNNNTIDAGEKRNTIHPPAKDEIYENVDYTNLYYALYDCKPEQPDELAFKKGDLIFILHRDSDSWWTGKLEHKMGLVPTNFLSAVYENC